jgi:phosphate transport system substrate-binding protein
MRFRGVRAGGFAILVVSALLVAGCGGDDDEAQTTSGETRAEVSGSITADGSSTVGPYATAAAERFQRQNSDVRITVGVSGTGGGFERFCRGETDLSNASRPIEDDEQELCRKNGVEYVEFHVANDAITVVVNEENDWATCLTVEQLKSMWEPGSKVDNWSEVDSGFADEGLSLAGPGTDSGTFDFFTDAIVGEEGASRSDYTASENDNVIVQAVSGEKGGLGYFGFSYFEQNQDKLNALEVDDGKGCVAPSAETVQDGTYQPLSRPLFIYAKKESFTRPEVQAFISYTLDNEKEIADATQFVSLTPEQLAEAKASLEQAVSGTGS